jgi:hypothetical protein
MSFWESIATGVGGEKAMVSWDEIYAGQARLKSQLTPSQNAELNRRLDFHEDMCRLVITELSPENIAVCSAFGMLVAVGATALDYNGYRIEKFINGLSIKDINGNKTTVGKFDTGNIFDIKRGAKHREQLFHSGNLFKKAPADFIMPNGVSVEEMMGGR